MPIHDQGYRRYDGVRTHGRAWLVIARTHILSTLRSKRFMALLLVAWGPFVVRAVQIYIATNVQQVAFLAPTTATFREFLGQQSLFVFLVTISLSGLIADDRRANALQLYLSKPLTRVDYLSGKLTVVMVFLLAVTLLPALLLLLLQVLFAGSAQFLRQNLFLVPAIVLYSLIETLLAAFAILALSAISKSRRFVSIMYAGIVFFTAAMYQALRAITGSQWWALLSPGDALDVIADRVFRVPGSGSVPLAAAVAVVAALITAAVLVLERRVRGVEVVQ